MIQWISFQQWQHLTSTQFSHPGRSSYFSLSQNSHVYWHCMKQPMAGLGRNGLRSLSGREQWMAIYGKICSQQDWAAEAAKSEATELYRCLEHKLWPKNGERLQIFMHTKCIFACKDRYSLVSRQTRIAWDSKEILSLCTHPQISDGKGWVQINDEFKHWIQLKHAIFLHRGNVWRTNVKHTFYIKQWTMWCYGCS